MAMPNYFGGYPSYTDQFRQQQQPLQLSTINGKIVDSEDMVRIQEVPLGSYGVFPQADMNVVYIKVWNSDGTTSIIRFNREKQVASEVPKQEDNLLTDILSSIKALDKKVSSLSTSKQPVQLQKKKRLDGDDNE